MAGVNEVPELDELKGEVTRAILEARKGGSELAGRDEKTLEAHPRTWARAGGGVR